MTIINRKIIKEFNGYRAVEITYTISSSIFIIERCNLDAMNNFSWEQIDKIEASDSSNNNQFWLYDLLKNLK